MSVIEYVLYAQSLRIIILEVVKVAHYLSIDSHHADKTPTYDKQTFNRWNNVRRCYGYVRTD